MKNILVTGGAGFIGSKLCEMLLARGYKVTCLDNFSTGSYDNIGHLPNLRTIQADVNEKRTWSTLGKFDVVFHYAATVGVRRTEENPGKVLHDVHGMQHLTYHARQGKIGKIIFASSSEVYGNSPIQPLQEEVGICGWTPYTVVKLMGEQIFQALWEEHGIPTVSLRFFNVYGPRQIGNGYGFVVSRFVNQVINNMSPTVYGNGKQTRDFVYINDNVEAAIQVMENPSVEGGALNIGSGRETSINELAQLVIDAAGKTGRIFPVYQDKRSNEIMHRCASVFRLKKLLKFHCRTPIEKGLAQTVAHFARQPVLAKASPSYSYPN